MGPETDARRSSRRGRVEMIAFVAVAVVLALGARAFLIQVFVISSESMRPALEAGDRVLVLKADRTPERGDVVVVTDPAVGGADPRDLVKRVVAVGGETVEITVHGVLVDGVEVDEPYLGLGTRHEPVGPVLVPEGEVFLLGDARAVSRDSRVYGPVGPEQIVGRALIVVWPPVRWGGI